MSNLSDNSTNSFLDQDPKIPNQSHCLFSFVPRKEELTKRFNKARYERIQNELESKSEILLENINKEPKLLVSHIMNLINPILNDTEREESEALHKGNGAVKFRGAFSSMEEAKKYSEYLSNMDNRFDIYLGQTGFWYPFDPPRESCLEHKHRDEKLNQLLKGYHENKMKSDILFKQRMREMMEKKIEEKAKASVESEKNREEQNSGKNLAENQVDIDIIE